MSLERDLKEAFERHEDDARVRGDAWSGVERGVRRAHSHRVAFIGALGVVLIVAAAIAVPKLGADRDRSFAGDGSGSPSPAVDSTAGWARWHNALLHVQARYPKDWKTGAFEGSYEFEPAGFPSLAQGGPETFAVELTLRDGAYDDPPTLATGKPGDAGSTDLEINGRAANRFEYIAPGGPHEVRYRIDWTGIAVPLGTDARPAPMAPTTLFVVIQASSDPLWNKWGAVAEDLVRTIAPYVVTAEHGTIAAGVARDERTDGLIQFLEARVDGYGAEEYMSANAKKNFADDAGLGLYASGSGSKAWVSYEIRSRADADASSSEFTVTLTCGGCDPAPGALETIGVDSGATTGNPEVIRFVSQAGA